MSEKVWFSPLRLDHRSFQNFAPTFPRRISGFIKYDERLFVVLANGERYEVHQHYFEPRQTFAEWALAH